MLLVTGGTNYNGLQWTTTDTTEVFPYTGPDAGSWRVAGLLPSPRAGLRAARLADLVHVNDRDEMLAWDSVSETWTVVGHTTTARSGHGVTEVSLAVMDQYCQANN